jgi:hypothetical protein
MDKEDAFWIGNCIGVVALLATIIIFAPIKNKERQAYEAKQKAVAQAAQAAKQKETLSAKNSVRQTSPINANSIGASQAAGAAAASRQKLHS